jgi:peptide/nickel transport system permease protein/oligopeptide transport system permease protein
VTVLVFVMVRLVPGDPIDMMFANTRPPSPEERAALRHQLGLDRPIHEQYVRFVADAATGDLGKSFRSRQPVVEEITARLPNTLKLTAASLTVAVVIGVLAGTLAAVFRGTWVDGASMLVAVLGVSIPGFWLGLMAMLLFSVRLGWLPVAGAGSWKHLVLPAFTLGVLASAVLARMTRSSMLDALSLDYVRTARAKGLRETVVVLRHALRNALIPIVTIVGLQIGSLLSGAFIIESVFGYPGVGQLAVNALQNRDFPVIQGIVLLVALTYVAVNILVDVLYGMIDPRVSVK